jgi:CheY-like chemotaxis protein
MVTLLNERGIGLSLGATDFLTKPIDRGQLRATLSRHCNSAEGGTILIIEDDPAARELVVHTVERMGFAPSTASNGEEGLQWLESHPAPVLVVLDLMMPVMNGFEFLEKMRGNELWRDIPVTVLSAKTLTDQDREMLDRFAQRVIAKGDHDGADFRMILRDLLTRANSRGASSVASQG